MAFDLFIFCGLVGVQVSPAVTNGPGGVDAAQLFSHDLGYRARIGLAIAWPFSLALVERKGPATAVVRHVIPPSGHSGASTRPLFPPISPRFRTTYDFTHTFAPQTRHKLDTRDEVRLIWGNAQDLQISRLRAMRARLTSDGRDYELVL